MKLHFHKIRWKNFLSSGNAFNEITLDKHHMTFIWGPAGNGIGKCLLPNTIVDIQTDKETLEQYNQTFVYGEYGATQLHLTNDQLQFKSSLGMIIEFYTKKPDCIGKLKVKTRFGYKKIEYVGVSARNSEVLEVMTNTKRRISCSPDHLLWDYTGKWKKLKEFSLGEEVLTENGFEKIQSIILLPYKTDLLDLQVEEVKEYYANGFVSHNSTFIDALCFALFGKAYRNINKPELINSINKKKLLVELELKVGQREVMIRRGMKPGIFELYINGKLVNQTASPKDYQRYLEENVLKLNFKTFSQIVVLGSSNYVPFMRLPAAHRREIIEDLLDLSIFSRMNILLKGQVGTLKDRLSDEMRLADMTKGKLDTEKHHRKSLVENNRLREEDYQSKINDVDKDIGYVKEDQTRLTGELQKLEEEEKRLSVVNESLVNELFAYERTLRKDIKDSVDRKDFFISNDTCPTCEGEIGQELRQKKIIELDTDLETTTIKLEKLLAKKETILDLKIKRQEAANRVSECLNQLNKCAYDIRVLDDKKTVLLNEMNRKEDTVLLASLNERIARLEADMKKHLGQIEQFKKTQSAQGIALEILKDTGIKSKIISIYLPVINTLVNKYLETLELYLDFQFDENFNEKMLSRFRDNFSYGNFSEGEKTRIDLSLMFAWRALAEKRSNTSTNLLVLDEVGDSTLDEAGVNSLYSILQELTGSNIFIISHKDTNSDKYNNIIQVEKKNGFSTLKDLSIN